MEPVKIAEEIKKRFPEEVLGIVEFRGQVSLVIRKERLLEICRWLHDDPELRFDYLKDLCGVDYLGKKAVRFEVVYTLYSMSHRHMIRLRAEVGEDDPAIDSVMPVWIGADWHERECYDMFGIVFNGHPDLRRILLPEDWEGHPLKKDYPLEGPEKEWHGFQEVLDRSEELKEFRWQK
jgi:NADH-quinone oxidoreductase subunit C